MRVETIFGGPPCRCSLTPRVSPSRAPVLSFAHYFQAPATQSNPLHLIGVLLPIRNSLAPDFRTIQNTQELGLAGFQFDLLPIFTRQWHSPANFQLRRLSERKNGCEGDRRSVWPGFTWNKKTFVLRLMGKFGSIEGTISFYELLKSYRDLFQMFMYQACSHPI